MFIGETERRKLNDENPTKLYEYVFFSYKDSRKNNKEYIFDSKKDIEIYLEILQEVKEEIPISIISYCIMNNHARFLFYIDEIDKMIKFMHKTGLKYAKYYNKKYNRVGYVFRGRYKMQEICTLRHFYNCIYYIHQNPIKANICEKAEDYPYSSLKNNCFKIGTEMERKLNIGREKLRKII